MKKKLFIFSVVFILTVTVLVIIKNNRFPDVEPSVKKLIYSCLDIQYNRFSIVNPNKIIIDNFYKKSRKAFFNYDKWPCFVLWMQEREYKHEKYVCVRIADRKGEYYQDYIIVKKSGKYFIKNISYDI